MSSRAWVWIGVTAALNLGLDRGAYDAQASTDGELVKRQAQSSHWLPTSTHSQTNAERLLSHITHGFALRETLGAKVGAHTRSPNLPEVHPGSVKWQQIHADGQKEVIQFNKQLYDNNRLK